MKANKQSKVKVPKSGFKRSRFNWSHDVNTTFNWGEIQPTMCKLLIPDTKTTVQAQSLIRLAPMVAPTFGRVKYKTFSQFVPCADVMPNFDAMMAQEPVFRNGVKKIPQNIPSISLGVLSSYVLFGARANIYWADSSTEAQKGNYKTRYRHLNVQGEWSLDSKMVSILNDMTGQSVCGLQANGLPTTRIIYPSFAGFSDNSDASGNRVVFYPRGPHSFLRNAFPYAGTGDAPKKYGVTLSNKTMESLFPIDRAINVQEEITKGSAAAARVDDTEHEVTFDSADYIIEFNVAGSQSTTERSYYALAFELSDYGKRIRKVLQGCGYQIDFASTERVSILPLLAQYKAYFDIFGLQLFQGWETTGCASLIDYLANNFVEDITNADTTMLALPDYDSPNGNTYNNSMFVNFMLGEVGNEWYSEEADYIGAHMAKLAVSPTVDPSGFISVDANGIDFGAHIGDTVIKSTITNEQASQMSGWAFASSQFDMDGRYPQDQLGENVQNGNVAVHSFINQVQHGQVDAELLKRMYKWVNRNSILGRVIEKILRAQGLGKYCDECKSNYIGSTDTMITISDVVSTAATEDATLGEFGGKGLQYTSDKTIVFENDCYGYWITLATIIPEAGYTQGLDPTLKVLDKFNMYNPDFDALGMEMTTKDTVVGCRYNVGIQPGDATEIIDDSRKGFGFIPRYSKFKVCQNLVNGDFNRHNRRDVYLPYTLDRQLNVNDYSVKATRYLQEDITPGSNDNSTGYVTLNRSATTQKMPVAGNVWRLPTKYAWLGNFNRIFYNIGLRDDFELEPSDAVSSKVPASTVPGFSDFNDDNFLSHSIIDCQAYAPMKPIEDSYGLDDDEDTQKAGAEFVNKA